MAALGIGVNYEEAANMVSEFIYSIDNLPHEAAHILQEMKSKDTRVQELQQEIDKDSSRYIRHALRAASSASSTTATTPAANSASTSGQSTPSGSAPPQPPPPPSQSTREPSPKSAPLPGKIAAAYAEIHTLTAEKCALAQRIIDLVQRTQSRLETDLIKIRLLQGEPPEGLGPPIVLPGLSLGLGLGGGGGGGREEGGIGGRGDPALKITESLRNVLAAGLGAAAGGGGGSASGTSTPGHVNKKRKTGTTSSHPTAPILKLTPSVLLTSTSTLPTLPLSPLSHKSSSTSHKRRSSSPSTTSRARTAARAASRLSKQIVPDEEGEEDAEGEVDDAEGDAMGEAVEGEGEGEGEEGEDERLYCLCQKQSYGDMIGCDNDSCPYEWFHLSCVGMKQPLPDKWYCTVCIENGAAPAQARKVRKK